ncbi:hypothetical protein [Bacillus sp. 165]|uniref:hypothetical protein n=1 Tax=Bacillus sp. 165 TaxID=1529117 RepID=UPI001AD9F27B|nr:hypothetical protein [Bacillus sp. 165]MBO9130386.1 hypothetical protein [Bacillus sp. 165]
MKLAAACFNFLMIVVVHAVFFLALGWVTHSLYWITMVERIYVGMLFLIGVLEGHVFRQRIKYGAIGAFLAFFLWCIQEESILSAIISSCIFTGCMLFGSFIYMLLFMPMKIRK